MDAATIPEHEIPKPGALNRINAFIVERAYRELGITRWNTPEVKLLCAKFGSVPEVMAARMGLTPGKFLERMETNNWTKQDRIILCFLAREIDLLRGERAPQRLPIETSHSS